MSRLYIALFTLHALLATGGAVALGRTPQMGFNTWNAFRLAFNQTLLLETAQWMRDTGLYSAGYKYFNVDDGWSAKDRNLDGTLAWNTTVFPNGLPSFVDRLHTKGFKVGIYGDSGIFTCGWSSGSLGYEELDAMTFANWGIDYLKYDNCGALFGMTVSPGERFLAMRNALERTGRDIFFSACQWVSQFPWFWMQEIAHSYRIAGDITNVYANETGCQCRTAYCLNTGYAGCSVLTYLRKMRELSPYTVVGSWLDMDMLEIGHGMTYEQEKTHFSFWAALKSPLIIGADFRTINASSVSILKNADIIAINQDSLGRAVEYRLDLSTDGKFQIWSGPLSGRRTVVLVLNEWQFNMTYDLEIGALPGLSANEKYYVYDVWADMAESRTYNQLSLDLLPNETKVLIFKKAQ